MVWVVVAAVAVATGGLYRERRCWTRLAACCLRVTSPVSVLGYHTVMPGTAQTAHYLGILERIFFIDPCHTYTYTYAYIYTLYVPGVYDLQDRGRDLSLFCSLVARVRWWCWMRLKIAACCLRFGKPGEHERLGVLAYCISYPWCRCADGNEGKKISRSRLKFIHF